MQEGEGRGQTQGFVLQNLPLLPRVSISYCNVNAYCQCTEGRPFMRNLRESVCLVSMTYLNCSAYRNCCYFDRFIGNFTLKIMQGSLVARQELGSLLHYIGCLFKYSVSTFNEIIIVFIQSSESLIFVRQLILVIVCY